MSVMAPCMPIADPSVLSSDRSATSAAADAFTIASPKPNSAESAIRPTNDVVNGTVASDPAQITSPSRISGRRPIRSDAHPIVGRDANEVTLWTPNNIPACAASSPIPTA